MLELRFLGLMEENDRRLNLRHDVVFLHTRRKGNVVLLEFVICNLHHVGVLEIAPNNNVDHRVLQRESVGVHQPLHLSRRSNPDELIEVNTVGGVYK